MPWVVIFDTNVLLSAIGWGGVPARCLALARSLTIVGVTCPELMAELHEKLRTKLGYSPHWADRAVADLLTFLRVVRIPRALRVIAADPDDDVVLECAVQAQATHIVTGDRRHLLPLQSYEGIAIVTPAAFLGVMDGQP